MSYAEIRLIGLGKNRPKAKYYIPIIARRDGWICWICEEPIDPETPRTHDEGATLDHVIPFAARGGNLITNLRLAHRCCNESRGKNMKRKVYDNETKNSN